VEFLDINVDHGRGLEDLTAGFSHLGALHLQLDRNRCLRYDFAELRKISFANILQGQADNLVSGESIDNGIERSIKEDLAVIDNDDAIAKLFNVLHVMTCQHRHNPVLGVVESKKFADALLTYDIETDGWFIEKKDPGLVDERRDQFHLHPLSQRKFAHHHVHL